ncbi:MAG TPA: hypothetical protein VF361_03560 [Candidatus Limnocylindrales bacterium]
MVNTGATPRKSWRRSTWALAIGTGLALLVIWLTWLRQGDMPGPLVAVAVGWIVLAPPIYDHSRPAIKTVATVFIAIAGGLFVWKVVRDALDGMDYGFALVKWSSDPGVFRTELILALCAAIVTFVSVWKIARSNRATGQIVMWLGLGMLGLGILSYGVGQTGFQVVEAPFEPLERPEWFYVFLGVISAVIGGLMAFIGVAFMAWAEAHPSEAE